MLLEIFLFHYNYVTLKPVSIFTIIVTEIEVFWTSPKQMLTESQIWQIKYEFLGHPEILHF